MLVGPWGQKVSKTMTRPHQYVHNLFGNVAIKKKSFGDIRQQLQSIADSKIQFARHYWNFQ